MLKKITFALTALSLPTLLFCQTEEEKKQKIVKMSEAFGHLIGKNIESIGLELDVASIIQGLKDAAAGKTSPMTELECIQAITSAQEAAFKEKSIQNLKSAEEFLSNNSQSQGIIELEEGKIQYKINTTGFGASLEEHDTPLIRYVGKFLDGSVFSSSTEDEILPLDDVIPGLRSGLIGMKEGEKRVIFIHPDLAYGTKGTLPPNSLLTFEIDLIKKTAPKGDQTIQSSEIAIPEIPISSVR